MRGAPRETALAAGGPAFPVPWRLHRGGRFRAWLGSRAGGDRELGDRLLRRGFHLAGAAVLLYYVLPVNTFLVLPTRVVLLLALLAVLVIELLRLFAGLEVPTIRPYERHRVASYAWYGIALVAAVLLFPPLLATVVVLGTAIVDPVIGELRLQPPDGRRAYPGLPLALYGALAFTVLLGGGTWGLARAALGAGLAALIAVAVERPKLLNVDDDLAMTLLPALALLAVGSLGPGAPLAGAWP